MTSVDDVFGMFQIESKKLENLINNAITNSELSIHEIIETYYQIMNISSMITMLKPQIDVNVHKSFLEQIQETEKIISEKFNSIIHPQVIGQLTNSIENTKKNLQSGNVGKSKEEIENEAKKYEKLRQMMSTKEFVERYDKGLSHD